MAAEIKTSKDPAINQVVEFLQKHPEKTGRIIRALSHNLGKRVHIEGLVFKAGERNYEGIFFFPSPLPTPESIKL